MSNIRTHVIFLNCLNTNVFDAFSKHVHCERVFVYMHIIGGYVGVNLNNDVLSICKTRMMYRDLAI